MTCLPKRLLLAAAAVVLLADAPVGRAYELKRTEAGRAVRWVGQREIAVRIDPRLYEHFGRERLHEALALAALAWRAEPGVPRIRFVAEPPPEVPDADGVPGVYLDRDWLPEDGALAVTLLAYEEGSGRIVDADVVLSRHYAFEVLRADPGEVAEGRRASEGEEAVYDLASTVAHELGHALGLDESRDDPEATMWPLQRPWDTRRRDLSEDDRAGLRALYGAADLPADSATGALSAPGAEEGPPGGCGGASVAGPPRLATAALLAWSLLVLAWRRRAPRLVRARWRRWP